MIPPPSADAPILVFDGVCVLCNGWVDFLLRRGPASRHRFAAMQGESGRALLAAHGLDPEDPVSFLLVDGEGAHVGSDAVLRVLSSLGGGWRCVGALHACPRPLRDAAYRWIARNRYRMFGKRDACRLPDADARERFLP